MTILNFKKEKRFKKGNILAGLRKSHLSLLTAHSQIVKMQVLSALNALKTHIKKDVVQIIA